jgi:hypothetical protein
VYLEDTRHPLEHLQWGLTLDSKIKWLSLAVLFFRQPLKLHIRGGITNSKPSGPIIMIDQLEVLSLSQVQFITLVFLGV